MHRELHEDVEHFAVVAGALVVPPAADGKLMKDSYLYSRNDDDDDDAVVDDDGDGRMNLIHLLLAVDQGHHLWIN